MKWTNTIEVVVKVENAQARGQWQIGEAIGKDIRLELQTDEEKIPQSVFKECGERLEARGYDKYSASHLSCLYRTAMAFDPQHRNPDYSWDVHYQAGTPNNLKKLVSALRKFKKPITGDNIHDLRTHWADEERARRQKAADAAAKKKKDAKAKKKKATEDLLAAKDEEARAKAKEELEDVKREIEELTETIRENAGAPSVNTDLAVDVEDVSMLRRLAVYFRIELHISKMKKEANETLKDISQVASMLSERERDAVETGCTEILAILEQIRTVSDRKPSQRFPSIQGGKT